MDLSQGHTAWFSVRKQDWPLRGWHRRTPPSLPLCCLRTAPPPSSAHHPVPASPACKLLLLLSRTVNPLINHPTHINKSSEKYLLKSCTLPETWAPGFTHAPNSTGSVLLVTVTMTSAPLTASSAELKAFTGPGTCRQNVSALCLVWLHTRTCSDDNTQTWV